MSVWKSIPTGKSSFKVGVSHRSHARATSGWLAESKPTILPDYIHLHDVD